MKPQQDNMFELIVCKFVQVNRGRALPNCEDNPYYCFSVELNNHI